MNTIGFEVNTDDNNINVDLYNYTKTDFFKKQLPEEHKEMAIELELKCDFKINWYFYTEMRTWGVKDIGAYATGVSLIYGFLDYIVEKNETITEHELEVEINFDDFEIISEGQCKDGFIQVENCEVDFESKKITISFE